MLFRKRVRNVHFCVEMDKMVSVCLLEGCLRVAIDREQGVGCGEQGAGSGEQGAGSREQGVGSSLKSLTNLRNLTNLTGRIE